MSLFAEERDYIEMGRLRDSLPSVKKSLMNLHRNLTDTLTSKYMWQNIAASCAECSYIYMYFIYRHHDQEASYVGIGIRTSTRLYQPALLDVMDYLESVSIKRFILHYYIRHASIDELGVLSKTSSPFDVTIYSYCILSG